jgi:hypothetical protein
MVGQNQKLDKEKKHFVHLKIAIQGKEENIDR